MIALLTDNMDQIAALCRRHGVRKLEIFGSAATGAFDPATSDLDFVVEFHDYGPGISDRFLDFRAALVTEFDRPVDFVFASKLSNPYFREAVDETRELVYEARDGEVAA